MLATLEDATAPARRRPTSSRAERRLRRRRAPRRGREAAARAREAPRPARLRRRAQRRRRHRRLLGAPRSRASPPTRSRWRASPQPDPFSGLPDARRARDRGARPRPLRRRGRDAGAERRPRVGKAAEAAALASDPRITNSEGAEFAQERLDDRLRVDARLPRRRTAARASLSASAVASDRRRHAARLLVLAQRHLAALEPPADVGARAAARALRRLGARQVPTQEVPVVFDPEIAATCCGHLAGAVSGRASTAAPRSCSASSARRSPRAT